MDHKQGLDREQVFFTSLDEMLPDDSFARVIDLFIDHMPLEELGFEHVILNKEGNEPYHTSDMFKLILYGQRYGLRSANRLSRQCLINCEVRWLLKELRPSARTICYFRVNNGVAIKKAHRYFIKLLKSWDLIGGELLALDSTKMRGQNSLKNNYNQKKINRHLEYIENKIEEYLNALAQAEEKNGSKKKCDQIEDKLADLETRKEAYLDLERKVKESPDGQLSTTDPDSRAVIYHRNIVQVGYNIQATVDADHLFIVDVYAGGVTDRADLGVAASRAQKLLDEKKIDIRADTGYHNGADIAYCERKGIRTFIPPGKKHHQKEEGFRKSDFEYDRDQDVFICPDGQKLSHELTYKKQNSHRKYRVKRYGTQMCEGCPLRAKCTTAAAGRKIERPNHQQHVDRNDSRTRRYSEYYRLRQQIVEPIFGIMKRQWHFDHLLLRTREKVETEVTLAVLAYNLMRLIKLKSLKWIEKAMKKAFINDIMSQRPYERSQNRKRIIKMAVIMSPYNTSLAA